MHPNLYLDQVTDLEDIHRRPPSLRYALDYFIKAGIT
jgi:hypothetical protein